MGKFWRVNVLDTPFDAVLFTEIEFRTSIGGPSVSTGGTAYSITGTPANAFDGNNGTWWFATNMPRWIVYEHTSSVDVVEVAITMDSGHYPIDFDIDVSDDGISWANAAQIRGETSWTNLVERTFSFASTPAPAPETPHAYWRFVSNDSQVSATPPACLVAELQFRELAGLIQVPSGGTPLGSGGTPANAFDNNATTTWFDQQTGLLYVGYQFAAAINVAEIYIQVSSPNHNSDPKDFTIEWSDDGSGWTPYFSVTGELAWSDNESRLFLYVSPSKVVVDIQQIMTAPQGISIAYLEQVMYLRGLTTVNIEQVVEYPSGKTIVDIQQAMNSSGKTTFDISQVVYSASAANGAGKTWRPFVTLKGVDVSASLTRTIRIEAEEDGARIAEFTLEPAIGPVSLTDWINAPVYIWHALVDAAGVVTEKTLIFRGNVDLPTYDPIEKLTRFDCTDNFQTLSERTSPEGIDALVGGYYSVNLFDDQADGWRRMKDRLSTIPYSIDLDVNGSAIKTSWAAKATPDLTVTDAEMLDKSISVDLAEQRSLINRTTLTFNYRLDRYKERQLKYQWNFPGGMCGYLRSGAAIPTRAMVQAAIESAGWLLVGDAFYTPPARQQWLICEGSIIGWLVSDAFRASRILGTTFTVAKRWAQPVTENYTVIVQAPDSIFQYGPIENEIKASLDGITDPQEWENADVYTDQPAGGVIDVNGDTVWDMASDQDTGRLESDNAVETLIARAKTDMLSSHRRNIVQFSCLMIPWLERYHTVKLQSQDVTAQGKISQFVHTMNIQTGETTTTISIAVSKSGGASAQDTPITAPPQPISLTRTKTALELKIGGTYIGADLDNPAQDPSWHGWITNIYRQNSPANPATAYNEKFVFPTDEIEASARDETEIDQSTTNIVSIPDETLTINA